MNDPGFRERLKQKVLEVSREILKSQGLQGLQARKVAVESGCSVGTIYNMYGSLDAVIITANAGTLADLRDSLMTVRESAPTLAERLDALSMAYLAFAVERNNEWRAVFEHRLSGKTVVPEWYRHSQAELFAIVEDILRKAIPDREACREAARALFAAVHGIVSLALDEKLHDFDRAATERQIRFVLSSVAAGLEARNADA